MRHTAHAAPRLFESPLRRWVAVAVALLLATASVVGLGQRADAATTGITSQLLLNGSTYQGVPVVNEGDTLTLRVQYDNTVAPGSTVVFDLGTNVTLTGVPSANTAIASVSQSGNQVSVTFKDPWPSDVNQGVFDLSATVNQVDHSGQQPIAWKIDGDEQSVQVIVRNSGDTFQNVVPGSAKGVTPSNLNGYVHTSNDGVVTVDPAITGADLSYTLTLNSTDALSGTPIADQLPAGLGYEPGSFAATLTTWDADGLNQTTAPFAYAPTIAGDGASFTSTVTVPQSPSVLKIAYKAHVTDVAALQTALQAAADARAGSPGSYSIQLQNTADFDGTAKTATVTLQGSIPGVGPGSAFGKTSDWSSKNVTTDADGNLAPPAELTYTLSADLTKWTGDGANFTLSTNVVISDPLPAQASWNTADPAFLTAAAASGATFPALTHLTGSCPATAADFAADAYIGQWCVNGQTLLVNLGKDNGVKGTIQAKALLNTVTGLATGGSTTVVGALPYQLANTATFAYNGTSYNAGRTVTVVQLPTTGGGLNDSSVFTKTATVEDPSIAPGESAKIDYAFDLAAGKGIDIRTTTIVDYLDQSVFGDVDPSTLTPTGTYDGQALNASHFVLSKDADGNLVVALSDAGKAIVTAQGVDKAFTVEITLTTLPFDGKVTKDVTNKATLFGTSGDPLYWSDVTSEATSYGNEAEVRKLLYDGASGSWSADIKAKMDGQGGLVDDVFVYRIQFIPHGSYDGVVIIPVADVLPSQLEFLGFASANPDGSPSTATLSNGPVDIGGHLDATYDPTAKTVTLAQHPGQVLDASQPIAAYFAVRVLDPSGPIVNSVGGSTAIIDPQKAVSVGDYVWVDTNRDGRQDPGEPGIPGVVLTITGPDGGPVVDVDGNPVGPTTTDANGKYSFDDLPALTGGQTYTVHIDRTASADALRPYVPTRAGAGDRAGDSSTWDASTVPGDLHDDGDRDPTLDFGFVTPAPLASTGVDPMPGIALVVLLLGLGGVLTVIVRRRRR